MAKQSNMKPPPAPTKAASGSGGKGAPAQTIKGISGPKLTGSHVGPKGAPFYQK